MAIWSCTDTVITMMRIQLHGISGAQAQCMLNHDSDIFVPNSKSEAEFVSNFIGSQAQPEVYTQNSLADVMIGARQSITKSYIEYSDGM